MSTIHLNLKTLEGETFVIDIGRFDSSWDIKVHIIKFDEELNCSLKKLVYEGKCENDGTVCVSGEEEDSNISENLAFTELFKNGLPVKDLIKTKIGLVKTKDVRPSPRNKTIKPVKSIEYMKHVMPAIPATPAVPAMRTVHAMHTMPALPAMPVRISKPAKPVRPNEPIKISKIFGHKHRSQVQPVPITASYYGILENTGFNNNSENTLSKVRPSLQPYIRPFMQCEVDPRDPIAALRKDKYFNDMIPEIQRNPELLVPVLKTVCDRCPPLLRLIRQNEEKVMFLLTHNIFLLD